jgi:hypothetical protein
MIPSEDNLLGELEAAPTLWSAADVAERLAKSGTNPVYPIIANVLRRFSLNTWSKRPRGLK